MVLLDDHVAGPDLGGGQHLVDRLHRRAGHLGRVEGLLSALSAAYGEGASVSADDLEPYLGEAGNLPRYALTDAIDRGEPRVALRVLHRLFEAGGLAPMQILATLHGHFSNMLALDGADALSERDAASILGTAPFVAKKALQQSRRLGSEKIAAAIKLLAAADLDCRGMSGLDPEVVVEILVARLATQTRPANQTRPARVRTGAR